jgi:hypothetical protein
MGRLGSAILRGTPVNIEIGPAEGDRQAVTGRRVGHEDARPFERTLTTDVLSILFWAGTIIWTVFLILD